MLNKILDEMNRTNFLLIILRNASLTTNVIDARFSVSQA